MRAPTLAIAFCAAGSHAFVGAPVQQMGCAATTRPHSCAQPLSMVATPLTSKRPTKLKVIEEVTELLSKTTFIFSVPSSNIKANDVVKLRKELPEGCTARVVKNKLMRIACKGTEFEELSEVTTGENFWMFVEGEDNLAEPIKIITAFAKEADKDNVAWQTPFKAGVFGGELLDGPGVVAISKLPTKQELIQRLAIALNSVPTKLGRSINLVPTKIGRVVKLAFADEGAGGQEGAPAAEVEEAAAAPEAPVAEAPVAEAVTEVEAKAAAPPAEDAPAAE